MSPTSASKLGAALAFSLLLLIGAGAAHADAAAPAAVAAPCAADVVDVAALLRGDAMPAAPAASPLAVPQVAEAEWPVRPLRRYCRCGCGATCTTDADCGPGGVCGTMASCC